jgi:hypothetical protein
MSAAKGFVRGHHRELPWYVIGVGRICYRRGDVLDYIQRGLYGQGTVPARFRQTTAVDEG